MDTFRSGGPVHATCAGGNDNPAHNFMHFDHIGGTLLTLGQYTLIDEAYEVFHNALESEPEAAILTGFFFLAVTFTNTFVMLGLFLAVIANTFKEVQYNKNRIKLQLIAAAKAAKASVNLNAVHPAPPAPVWEDSQHQSEPAVVPSASQAGNKVETNPVIALVEDEDEDGAELLAEWASAFLKDSRMRHGASIVIILHLVTMAAAASIPREDYNLGIIAIFWACNGLLSAEVLVKLTAARGSRNFFANGGDVLDAVLSVCGLTALLGGPSILGLIPSIRIFRLCHYFPTLQDLLVDAIQTIPAFLNLILFVSIVSFCFAVAFRYIFRGEIQSRSNFGSLGHALITTFQVFTGDRWSEVLHEAMYAKPDSGLQVYAAVAIFIWLLFSRIIFQDLCIAVLIENFEIAETIHLISQHHERGHWQPGRMARIRELLRRSYLRLHDVLANPALLEASSPTAARPNLPSAPSQAAPVSHPMVQLECSTSKDDQAAGPSGVIAARVEPVKKAAVIRLLSRSASQVHLRGTLNRMGQSASPALLRLLEAVSVPNSRSVHGSMKITGGVVSESSLAASNRWLEKAAEVDTTGAQLPLPDEDSLFFFGPKNPLRVFCSWLAGTIGFQTLIYACIFLSCIILMQTPPSDDPAIPQGPFPLVFRQTCDKVLTGVFAFEFLVAVISKGFFMTRDAYLKSKWNLLDFVILALSLLDLAGALHGSLAKIGRLGRALRPLRLVKRNKGLREMMEALFATLPPLAYVTALFLMLGLVFSIVGMGLFGGRFHRCSYDIVYPQGKAECSGVYADASRGFLVPRAWWVPPHNFDTFNDATLTVFRLTTIKYVFVMRDAMDVTERNISPSTDVAFGNCLYFIIYLIVAAFFVMNVFIAFIVDGFNLNRGSSPIDIFYNKFQRLVDLRAPREIWFRPPRNKLSRSVRRMIETNRFRTFSLTCVAVNVIFMLSDHAEANEAFSKVMELQGDIFFGELVFEVFVNFIGCGFGGFIDDSWKFFDLVIMLGSASSYITKDSTIGRAAKVFRLFRVIRLMRMIKPVRAILETMIASLPQFGNIFLLLFLMYSIFATLFVQEIGLTRYGERLGPTASFENFVWSMTTIYQMVTLDEWMMIMDDASVQPPFCSARFEGHTFGDCGVSYARFLFVPFKLICEYIMLNLFIGVILEKFAFITDEISAKEDLAWSSGPSLAQFQSLVHVFERFAAGSNSISIQAAASSLLTTQIVPLGFRTPDGWLELEAPERAACRMIRAELNVHLRRKHQEEIRRREKWSLVYRVWDVICQVLPGPKSRFINGVEFFVVARVLLHWRKPSLLPDLVKSSRRELVGEVVSMACALTVYDCLREAVARRRHQETAAILHGPKMLRRWLEFEPHYARRSAFYATVRNELALSSASRHRQALECPADDFTVFPMVPFTSIPATSANAPWVSKAVGLELHDEVVSKRKVKVVRPRVGMEEFRRMAATIPSGSYHAASQVGSHLTGIWSGTGAQREHSRAERRVSASLAASGDGGSAVVLRFIDALNADRGAWAVDLSQWTWAGWQEDSMEDDYFLRPNRVSCTHDPARWTSLELSIPVARARRSAPRGFKKHKLSVSSLLDSALGADPLRDDKSAEASTTTSPKRASIAEDKDCDEEVWCVLDVQSFLETDGHKGPTTSSHGGWASAPFDGEAGGGGRACSSKIRLHLGRKAVMVGATEQREMQTGAVMEVVGYLGAAALAASGAPVPEVTSPTRSVRRGTQRGVGLLSRILPGASTLSADGADSESLDDRKNGVATPARKDGLSAAKDAAPSTPSNAQEGLEDMDPAPNERAP